MLDYRTLLGILALAIGIVSYSFYFADIERKKTNPDGFSWLIWGLLATITFFAQITQGAGAGAWITAFTAVVCITIALMAFYTGRNKIKTLDWVSLAGVLITLAAWKFTNDPLLAVILVIIVGALGFVPTFRKAYYKPFEETELTYSLNALKFAIAIFALGSLNLVTTLYPASLVVMNLSLSGLLIVRRRARKH